MRTTVSRDVPLRWMSDPGLMDRLDHFDWKAEQRLKFELTEKGAKLRAEVEMLAAPFGEPPPPPPTVPRFFHYDRPFFVFLWRDTKNASTNSNRRKPNPPPRGRCGTSC